MQEITMKLVVLFLTFSLSAFPTVIANLGGAPQNITVDKFTYQGNGAVRAIRIYKTGQYTNSSGGVNATSTVASTLPYTFLGFGMSGGSYVVPTGKTFSPFGINGKCCVSGTCTYMSQVQLEKTGTSTVYWDTGSWSGADLGPIGGSLAAATSLDALIFCTQTSSAGNVTVDLTVWGYEQ
jgi:hypothetical protein